MIRRSWTRGDAGPVFPRTVNTARTVLAIAHHQQSGDRLSEFVGPLLEADRRVQVIWTLAPGSSFERSGHAFMRSLDAIVLPWEEAVSFEYDLAVAANHGLLEQVRAPVLVLPHGTGFSRRTVRGNGYGPPVARPVGGAVPGALTSYGRVVPAAIGIAHEDARELLTSVVAETAGIIHVVGDPCYDRALSALPERERFRRAAGVGEGQRLVVVSSSWGPSGVWGSRQDLIDRLMEELPPGHAAVLVLHPGTWWTHGPRQILAWLDGARSRGLRILAPGSPWLGLLVAADAVVGDSGSVTAYAAALGAAPLLAGGVTDIAPGSTPELLHRVGPHYREGTPLGRQIGEAVEHWCPELAAAVHARLTSAPGRSARLLREVVYRLMDMPEPGEPAGFEPLRSPEFVAGHSLRGERRAA
ncbi:hypothetical protein [Nocardiopsis ganjiahuensis]|uniref:hypothetical protein n=1 Tax=Nocardiopsis ganjiahuensis TaxID=239984 RepID=UPI0003480475|nr:hypothetical protein [Nocardiopsis ganjiahuensis]